jgi:exopolysaccharide production protein ExoQ
MAAGLALTLCVIFVIFMLRLDRKQAPEVSFLIWIPTIWLMITASKPLGAWFEVVGEDMESGSSFDRFFLSALLCIGIYILSKRRFSWAIAVRRNIWLFLLLGFMFVSIIWSETPYISFKRWIRELTAVVMALVVSTEPYPRIALQSIFRRTIYVLIPVSYLLIHYYPEFGRQYGRWDGSVMWVGAALHKNGLARLCLFSAIYLIWIFVIRRLRKDTSIAWYQRHLELFILILTFWLWGGPQHNLTYSATTTVAFVSTIMALIGFIWAKNQGLSIGKNAVYIISCFIIGYGVITPHVGELSVIDISTTVGRSETLTGRSDIWAFLIPLAMDRAILGYGIGGFWNDALRNNPILSSHAHNGYLDILLNFGFFGLVFFLAFFLSSVRKYQRVMSNDYYWGVLCNCYLLMTLIYNIAESSLETFSSHLTAVVIFLAVGVSNNYEFRQERKL